MAYLTIGQMAKLNNISKKTLLLYEEKGLLKPASINMKSGYRYYCIHQCAKLDLIKYMQSLNFTLTEIQEVLEKQDFGHLEEMLLAQIEYLEEERKRISVSLFSAQSYLRSIDCAKNREPAGQYMLRHFPARKLIIFRNVSNFLLDSDPGEESCSTQEWETLLHDFREFFLENGIPLTLFRNVGNMVSRESLLKGEFRLSCACVSVSDDYDGPGAYTIPEGDYLTFTPPNVFASDGRLMEGAYLQEMLFEIEKIGCEITGDYFGEVLAPAFFRNERNSLTRMQVPIRIAWSAQK